MARVPPHYFEVATPGHYPFHHVWEEECWIRTLEADHPWPKVEGAGRFPLCQTCAHVALVDAAAKEVKEGPAE
ncbi:MAG TPA: hypothetical protein VI138_00930 [Candidatus Dormibacteraeota bacterium]